jgi:hypothetical protein
MRRGRVTPDVIGGLVVTTAVLVVLVAGAMAQVPRGSTGRAMPPPTPTILPDEAYEMTWHETPQAYGGWIIGFNDEGDHIVVRECKYEGDVLVCTDWVVLEQAHWKWLKREVSRTMKW